MNKWIISGASGEQTGKPPAILTIIATADDTRNKVRPQEMEKVLKIVEKAIRIFDEKS